MHKLGKIIGLVDHLVKVPAELAKHGLRFIGANNSLVLDRLHRSRGERASRAVLRHELAIEFLRA
jgi:hypothetical protein